jgi:sugar-specific transcriptional regulator TrmB
LIEKIIGVPIEFRSIPLTNSFSVLLKHKKEELSKLESMVSKISIQRKKLNAGLGNKNDDLILIPRTEPFLPKIKEKIIQTKHSLDVLSTPSRDRIAPLHKETIHCLKRGVKIRILSDAPVNSPPFNKSFLSINNPLYQFRKTDKIIVAPLAIHDGKEVYIFISETTGFLDATAFFTNNPRLVRIIQEYFDGLWSSSQEIAAKETIRAN